MKRIFFLIIFSLLLFVSVNSNVSAQCASSCTSNTDCDPGFVCNTGVCRRWCTAVTWNGIDCETAMNFCDIDDGYEPVNFWNSAHTSCGCSCVNTNNTAATCTSNADCGNWLCANGRCSQPVNDCTPCTTSGGEQGGCSAPMEFPSSWTSSCNSCGTFDICCADPNTPTGGTAGCGNSCTATSDCIAGLTCSTSLNVCYGTPANGSAPCPLCTSNTSNSGVCLEFDLCQNLGYNPENTSQCSDPFNNRCCTNTLSSTCNVSLTTAFVPNREARFSLSSNAPNTTYYVVTNPATCVGSLSFTTDTFGNATFGLTCPTTGSFTIYASKTTFPATDPNACNTTASVQTATSGDADCDNVCTDPNFPMPRCGASGTTPNCEDPPAPNRFLDCDVSGVQDCICCFDPPTSTVAPKPSLNPRCGITSINTAIGCIPVGDKNSFLVFILRWALGISGGTSFILMIIAGFQIMTSAGDKRQLQAGKELLTAAISGLLLIIFSVFILDLIGIRILRIPGL